MCIRFVTNKPPYRLHPVFSYITRQDRTSVSFYWDACGALPWKLQRDLQMSDMSPVTEHLSEWSPWSCATQGWGVVLRALQTLLTEKGVGDGGCGGRNLWKLSWGSQMHVRKELSVKIKAKIKKGTEIWGAKCHYTGTLRPKLQMSGSRDFWGLYDWWLNYWYDDPVPLRRGHILSSRRVCHCSVSALEGLCWGESARRSSPVCFRHHHKVGTWNDELSAT